MQLLFSECDYLASYNLRRHFYEPVSKFMFTWHTGTYGLLAVVNQTLYTEQCITSGGGQYTYHWHHLSIVYLLLALGKSD